MIALAGSGMMTTGQGGINQGVPEPRLARAAHEFEAQMMKELLRPMTASSALLGDDDSDGGGNGALGEFASESLAGALSTQGGFGIANRIVHDLSRSGNRPTKSQAIGNLPIDNGISPRE
jgi:Rod binding domain-containing protein